MSTLSWSPRVGQMWRAKAGDDPVEIEAEHVHAQMVRLRHSTGAGEWMSRDELDAMYEPACCHACGRVLTHRLLEANVPRGGQG